MRCRRSCELKLRELITATEIVLRAMDNRKNFQPEHFTWFVFLIQCLVACVLMSVGCRNLMVSI